MNDDYLEYETYCADNTTEALNFFCCKFSGDEETLQQWCECKNYVAQWGLEYEVFAIAYSKLTEDSSVQECVDAIGYQMGEWDL